MVESGPSMIGPINFELNCAGVRSAGIPNDACDVAGAGNAITVHSPGGERGNPGHRQ